MVARSICRAVARTVPRNAPRSRYLSAFRDEYLAHVEERAAMGIVPRPLDPAQCASLVEELKAPTDDHAFLHNLLSERVPPGVDEAAYVKASFLSAVVTGDAASPVVDKYEAMRLLGTMQGGYNVATLVDGLKAEDEKLAASRARR